MRYNFLLAFLVLFFMPVQAQVEELNQEKDLLLANLSESSADTAKYNTYIEIAESFKFIDLDTTLKYGILAESVINEMEYPVKEATARGFSVWVYFMKGEYDQSLDIAENAYALVADNPDANEIKFDLLHDQGTIYGALGMYELGLRKFYEIIDNYNEDSNEDRYYVTLSNIGVMYMRLESFETALEIFERLDREMPLDNPARVSIPVNLGFINYDLRNFDEAKIQLNRALSQTGNIDPRVFGLSNFKLGQVHSAELYYEQAISAFEASIEIFRSRTNELETVQSLNGLSLAYRGLNQLTLAYNFALEGYNIANSYNAIPEKQSTLESLY
jgi:tetratricopeptide (TPR) repeat protein